MALGTVTVIDRYVVGNKRVRVADVQLTAGANYTTGGETISLAAVGLRRLIQTARACGLATTTSGSTSRGVSFIYQTDGTVKMQVQTTASAEATSNSDQSTFTVRIEFTGF
jgi:hypothetical protein